MVYLPAFNDVLSIAFAEKNTVSGGKEFLAVVLKPVDVQLLDAEGCQFVPSGIRSECLKLTPIEFAEIARKNSTAFRMTDLDAGNSHMCPFPDIFRHIRAKISLNL
jgi:hypothetical protein